MPCELKFPALKSPSHSPPRQLRRKFPTGFQIPLRAEGKTSFTAGNKSAFVRSSKKTKKKLFPPQRLPRGVLFGREMRGENLSLNQAVVWRCFSLARGRKGKINMQAASAVCVLRRPKKAIAKKYRGFPASARRWPVPRRAALRF